MKAKRLATTDKKRALYIRSLIVLHDVSQQDIAKELGVSTATVSQVIHGSRKGIARKGPKIARIKKAIAERVGKTVDELWPYKDRDENRVQN
ncbi:MAG TPA: LacI family DNA-binding transcriptional regulator [Syntrophales bacterium]|nr:LacI family DNA-binding transcriptional regulator [Syntrophales bacterium]